MDLKHVGVLGQWRTATVTRARVVLLVAAVCAASATQTAALENVGRYVFVPARSSASVTVIDTSTDSIVSRIHLSGAPKHLAISKTLNYLVATNERNRTLSVVDLAKEATLRIIPLSVNPDRLLINPSGDLIAVADVHAGAVSTISLQTLREVGRVEGLHQPSSMFFSRDGKRLYVGNLRADYISVIDVEAGRIKGTISVTDGATMQKRGAERGVTSIASTPYTWAAFAVLGASGRLAVIDLRTERMIKTLELGGAVERAYSTQDGTFMIVPNNGDKSVSLISLVSMSEVARLRGAGDVTDVRTAYIETLAFVISRGESKVLVINLLEQKVTSEIALPAPPEIGAISRDGTKLYVALGKTDQLAVIDVIHRKLIKMVDKVGRDPWGAFQAGSISYCH